MRYISMLNPISFYHLWQYEYGKIFLNKMINSIIKEEKHYVLLDYFNRSFNSVRSYCIFESDTSVILVDFNINKRVIDDDLCIVNFLESSSEKNIYLIVFNNFKGKNIINNKIFNIFMEDNVLFAKDVEKQYQYDKELSKLLYMMDDDMFKHYLHEEKLLLG